MKTYIKPLISEYHVLTSFHLLEGSPGKGTDALASTQEVIGNQTEPVFNNYQKKILSRLLIFLTRRRIGMNNYNLNNYRYEKTSNMDWTFVVLTIVCSLRKASIRQW